MALDEGRRIVATARLDAQHSVYGSSRDFVREYLTYASAFDGTMRTLQYFTDICVVCANTLRASLEDGANTGMTKTSHRSAHNAAAVDLALGLDKFAARMKLADEMAHAAMSPAQVESFLSDVYVECSADEAREDLSTSLKLEKMLQRLMPQYYEAPGQAEGSRAGTLWGAFNAVTHDVDHVGVARTNDARIQSALFGNGAAVKARAWNLAAELVAA